jgi:hypothetical protein
MFRRIGVAAVVAVCALAGTAGALASGNSTTEVYPVEFTIAPGQCPNLPSDVEVRGKGVAKTTTTVSTGHDGKINLRVFTFISGTATDNFGGFYFFSYHNDLQSGVPGTGWISDHFRLSGIGKASGLFSAFIARVALDENFELIDFVPTWSVGDPIDFGTFTPLCDPL